MSLKKEQEEDNRDRDGIEGDEQTRPRWLEVLGVLEENICGITHELPIKPVIGMDGMIYERSAIEEWIQHRQNRGLDVTSPVTNLVMGETLLPAPHVKNIIEKVLKIIWDNGIPCELADSYLRSVAQRDEKGKKLAEMIEKAEAGDGRAMYNIGCYFLAGLNRFPKDEEQAAKWLKKSSDTEDACGMGAYGYFLLYGELGLGVNLSLGRSLLERAAEQGSNCACYYLGKAYMDGSHGFKKDLDMTKSYWTRVADGSCRLQHTGASAVAETKQWINDNP